MTCMDKFVPWPKGIARALIAGLLAWALTVQGLASVTSTHSSLIGVGLGSGEFEHCAAGGSGDDHRRSPEDHIPCSCCMPCRSGQLGDLVEMALLVLQTMRLYFPVTETRRAELLRIIVVLSSSGWTSSWSQRAPPLFS